MHVDCVFYGLSSTSSPSGLKSSPSGLKFDLSGLQSGLSGLKSGRAGANISLFMAYVPSSLNYVRGVIMD